MFTDVEQLGMRDGDEVFQRLCQEAVKACGSDMPAIERYVAERLAVMDHSGRAKIDADIKRVLLFQGPRRPGEQPN